MSFDLQNTLGVMRIFSFLGRELSGLTGRMLSVLCLDVCLLLSVPVAADAAGQRKDRKNDQEKVEEVERGSAAYFSMPFNGAFDFDDGTKSYEVIQKWRFYDNGWAVFYQGFTYPLYECYKYTVDEGVIRLKGLCTVRVTPVATRMLAEKPAPVDLKVESYGADAVLSGRIYGNNGRNFRLKMSSSDYISGYQGPMIWSVMSNRSGGITSKCENLWLVTEQGGASVREMPDGTPVVTFSEGDLICGRMGESGDTVFVDYIAGSRLYVIADEVKRVSNDKMLQEILYSDATVGSDFTEWQSTFPEKTRKAVTSGYSNGMMAGRQAAKVFVGLLFVALLFVILNLFNPPYYANFLFYSTYAVLVLISLFEMWYMASLGLDALWFVFDAEDFVHGFAGVVGTLVFIILQIFLIQSMENSLYEIYSAGTRCPIWVELVLTFAALYLALRFQLVIRGMPALSVYLILFAGGLPTFIGYMRRSTDKIAVLPFLILCYPLKYVVMLPVALLYVFTQAAGRGVTKESAGDDSNIMVRDMEGNQVNLTRTSNGDYIGNDGTVFTKSGDSFFPNGAGRSDGPYHR